MNGYVDQQARDRAIKRAERWVRRNVKQTAKNPKLMQAPPSHILQKMRLKVQDRR